MLSIQSINSNPIFAPLGHEEEFKQRIFLENFQRCMTIREFQKTAGLEIKKKLTETPSAKAFKEGTDIYCKDSIKEHGSVLLLNRFIDDRQLKLLAPLYHYKTGKIINKRKYEVKHALNYYQHLVFYGKKHYSEIEGNGFQDKETIYKVSRQLRRIGWNRFWSHIYNDMKARSWEKIANEILNYDLWHIKPSMKFKQLPKFEGL
jgi:hypothetical protein